MSQQYSQYNAGEYVAAIPYYQTRQQWRAPIDGHRFGLAAPRDGRIRQEGAYPGLKAPLVYRKRDQRTVDPSRQARASRVGIYDARLYAGLSAPTVPQQYLARRVKALTTGRR